MTLFTPSAMIWKTPPGQNEINSITFSNHGSSIAFSSNILHISITSIFDGSLQQDINYNISNFAVFDIKYHPSVENVLIASFGDGSLALLNTKGEIIKSSAHHGSQLLFMDVDAYGEQIARTYADSSIRLYDTETLQRTVILKKVFGYSQTQTNTSTSLIFHPTDQNIVLSSTALDRVLFWDIRTGNAERYLSGPLIRGPGLSMHDDKILTVSCRDSKPIELWDFGTAKKINSLSCDPLQTYFAGKIAPNGLEIVVASLNKQLTLYNYDTCEQFGQVSVMNEITSLSISPQGTYLVVGDSIGSISCFAIRTK